MSVLRRLAVTPVIVVGLVLVGAAPAHATAAVPSARQPTIQVGPSTPQVGGTVILSGRGWLTHHRLTITLRPTASYLARATTDSSGTFTEMVTIPRQVSGTHELQVADPLTRQRRSVTIVVGGSTDNLGVTVAGVSVGPAPSGGNSPGGQSTGAGGTSRTGVAAASFAGLGLLLVLSGGVLLAVGRRRKLTS